ncbi:MAG: hypothetical protein J6Z12_05645 [Paludibacteraceae bacterium]|nr:hypothetical protein [Paludibacteraceae bacterium]
MGSIRSHFGRSLLLASLVLLLAGAGCKRGIEPSWEAVAKRWYFVDYPFYQSCDRGSYVEMFEDGSCEALLLCTDEGPARHPRGSWSIDGVHIVIDCPIFGSLGITRNEGKVTRITETEMDLTLYVMAIPAQVKLSTRNPGAE